MRSYISKSLNVYSCVDDRNLHAYKRYYVICYTIVVIQSRRSSFAKTTRENSLITMFFAKFVETALLIMYHIGINIHFNLHARSQPERYLETPSLAIERAIIVYLRVALASWTFAHRFSKCAYAKNYVLK